MLRAHTGRRPVPDKRLRILPRTPEPIASPCPPTPARAPGRPVAALAICGAVLLVPLVLAVPGVPPEAGEEVVLAAGSHEGADPEGPGDVAVPVEDEALDQPVDSSPDLPEQSTGASPSAARRSGQKAASPPRARAATASTTSGKRNAVRTTSRSKAGPAAPPGTQAAKVAVAAAVAAQAPPPPPVSAPRPPAPPEPAPAAPTPAPGPATGAVNAVWDQLALCESGNTNDTGAPYYGFWQFSAGTWRSMGEAGLPNDHSRERQLSAAKRLQARSGWAQWPHCSRKLGLR